MKRPTYGSCAAIGCDKLARRAFCSDRCAARERKRRERNRDDFSIVGLTVKGEVIVTGPTAFGVPCSAAVAEIFRDDAQRFAAMGFTNRRP